MVNLVNYVMQSGYDDLSRIFGMFIFLGILDVIARLGESALRGLRR